MPAMAVCRFCCGAARSSTRRSSRTHGWTRSKSSSPGTSLRDRNNSPFSAGFADELKNAMRVGAFKQYMVGRISEATFSDAFGKQEAVIRYLGGCYRRGPSVIQGLEFVGLERVIRMMSRLMKARAQKVTEPLGATIEARPTGSKNMVACSEVCFFVLL